jgi:hypothetical protein
MELIARETDLMASQLTTLTSSDIRRFERDGYLVVRQAFSRVDALAMERQWWRELEGTHGIRRDDRASWRQIPGDLKAAKRDPIQARILTGQVRGVFDDLLGQAAWLPPRDWGRPLVTFPEPGAWEVPARLWHWDNPCELHFGHPRALFVVSFIGPVAPHSGPAAAVRLLQVRGQGLSGGAGRLVPGPAGGRAAAARHTGITGITGTAPGPVPGRRNHDDGASPWSQPPRCSIVVVQRACPQTPEHDLVHHQHHPPRNRILTSEEPHRCDIAVVARASHGVVASALAASSRRSAALILALPVRVISSARKNRTRRGTL